jgi:uncharacterized cupin superfamily protein
VSGTDPNIFSEVDGSARLGELAGTDHLGISVYELAPGEDMVFHYHIQREELLIVLGGTVELRTGAGRRELAEGAVVSFPRGERGAHGFQNSGDHPARVLVVSEQNGPNISVYPDENEIGIFDAAHPADRRFGARFKVTDALEGYGGGEPEIVPPGSP